MTLDADLLRAALTGYEHQLAEVNGRITAIRSELRKGSATAPAAQPKRTMSPAARRRIAAAQRKRWAAYRKTHEKAA